VPNVYEFKDFEGSSHRLLLDLIQRLPKGGTLLDLGAAGGELGQAARPHFDRTIGFEINVDCLGDLRERFDHVAVVDLERLTGIPKGARVIVLGDVLEHLRNPEITLSLVREAIDPAGWLLISVPNIANITIRLGLLFGIFTYRDRGILDHTHLRFYTHKTLRREIEDAGFEIVALSGSSIPIRLILGKHAPELFVRLCERILTLKTRLFTSLFAYQFIVLARPRP
jgi:predicted TPR repeat methyltransferase